MTTQEELAKTQRFCLANCIDPRDMYVIPWPDTDSVPAPPRVMFSTSAILKEASRRGKLLYYELGNGEDDGELYGYVYMTTPDGVFYDRMSRSEYMKYAQPRRDGKFFQNLLQVAVLRRLVSNLFADIVEELETAYLKFEEEHA